MSDRSPPSQQQTELRRPALPAAAPAAAATGARSQPPPEIVVSLRLAARAIGQRHGPLTLRQIAVLMLASEPGPPATVRGLAEQLRIPRSAVSRAIDTLVKGGLVEREADWRDRRSLLVHPTRAGRISLRGLRRSLPPPSA